MSNFLDDKLAEIYEEETAKGTAIEDIASMLLEECKSRLVDPSKSGMMEFINSVRKIDWYWQLFAKKRPELNKCGWRNWVLSIARENNKEDAYKKILKW